MPWELISMTVYLRESLIGDNAKILGGLCCVWAYSFVENADCFNFGIHVYNV